MARFSRSSLKQGLISLWDFTILLLLQAWDRITLPFGPASSRLPKPPKFIRSSRSSHRLDIQPTQQLTSFSCSASVLQSLHRYFTGEALSHHRAIELLRCKPDGASLARIASVIKRRVRRCRSRQLHSPSQLRQALKAGFPIIASDDLTYAPDGHAILVTGFTPKGFHTIDPATGKNRWRTSQRLLAASDEFIAISAR
jgi:hypothetical protein